MSSVGNSAHIPGSTSVVLWLGFSHFCTSVTVKYFRYFKCKIYVSTRMSRHIPVRVVSDVPFAAVHYQSFVQRLANVPHERGNFVESFSMAL